MFQRGLSFLLAASAAAMLPGLAVAQFDQVYVTGQPAPTRGVINGMTKDEVSVDVTGAPRSFPVNTIARILLADEPSPLSTARGDVQKKDWAGVQSNLKKLAGKELATPYLKQEAGFFNALSLARLAMTEGGDKKAAEKAMRDWVVETKQQNWHFYESAEVLGELAMSTGDFASAVKYFNALAAAPWEDYQLRANINIARALLGQGKAAEAISKFDIVISSTGGTPEAVAEQAYAKVGKAQCLNETGKADEGMAMLNEIIAKGDPAADAVLFGKAYNALGTSYLKTKNPKEALQAFLHTDILFNSDGETHAEALYHLSTLWTEVNKSDRAKEAKATLQERYGGSRWAQMK